MTHPISFAASDTVTFPASPTAMMKRGIFLGKLMAMNAMSLFQFARNKMICAYDINSLCYRFQMRGINTARIFAQVVQNQMTRYRTFCKLVTETMGLGCFPFIGAVVAIAFIFGPNPFPTTFGHPDFFPKTNVFHGASIAFPDWQVKP